MYILLYMRLYICEVLYILLYVRLYHVRSALIQYQLQGECLIKVTTTIVNILDLQAVVSTV